MSIRLGGCLALNLACLLAAGCDTEFKEFSPDGTFKVLLPAVPQERAHVVLGAPAKLWQVKWKDGDYAVAVVDAVGIAPESAEMERYFISVRDALLASVDTMMSRADRTMSAAKLPPKQLMPVVSREEKISLAGKYPGRHFEADIPTTNGVLKVHLYLVGGRLYQMMALGSKSFAASGNVSRFFTSLKIISEPPPPRPAPQPTQSAPQNDGQSSE